MDKIFSARVDEGLVRRIGLLARQLGTSKKQVIENAIRDYADSIDAEQCEDVLSHTFGAWERHDSPQMTVRRAREAFRRSMTRHNK